MDYQKDYVQKLNFKDYEKTNALVYELIMRNEKCQKCFKKLHRIIKKLNEVKRKGEPLINMYLTNKEFKDYADTRNEINSMINYYAKLQTTFLNKLSNYFLAIKGSLEEQEFSGYFKDFLETNLAELSNEYPLYVTVIYDINKIFLDELYRLEALDILDLLIAVIGYKIMSLKYDFVAGIQTSDEKKELAEKFLSYIDEKLKIVGFDSDIKVNSLTAKMKQNINTNIEPYYLKYKKYINDIIRLERFRHAVEDYMSYEFYIDFQQELYLDYNFYSQILQKDLKQFYEILQQKTYNELQIPYHASIYQNEIIKDNNFSLKVNTTFSIDSNLMKQIDSLYFTERILELIRQNPNEYTFRSTIVKPIYSRPTLFSERFRDITLTFNPNLSIRELRLQFEKIIELYQANKLKNRSIYETLGEEFGKWSKKIERPKRSYNSKQGSNEKNNASSKDILTILNNITDLLYIYDAHQQGTSHTIKIYLTNMAESSISSYLNMAQFLIEEQGYKILLTSHR